MFELGCGLGCGPRMVGFSPGFRLRDWYRVAGNGERTPLAACPPGGLVVRLTGAPGRRCPPAPQPQSVDANSGPELRHSSELRSGVSATIEPRTSPACGCKRAVHGSESQGEEQELRLRSAPLGALSCDRPEPLATTMSSATAVECRCGPRPEHMPMMRAAEWRQ